MGGGGDGGWFRWIEEKHAVRMNSLGGWVGGRRGTYQGDVKAHHTPISVEFEHGLSSVGDGGWVGGWVGGKRTYQGDIEAHYRPISMGFEHGLSSVCVVFDDERVHYF